MKIITSFFLLALAAMNSCAIPNEARVLMKTTKEWRDSPVELDAYADTPFSGTFLRLRRNGKFEHTSSGLLRSFEAGTWSISNDTLRLVYFDSDRNVIRKQNVLIEKATSTLIFEGDVTPAQLRLRIIAGNL
jgi:hypothetical protein